MNQSSVGRTARFFLGAMLTLAGTLCVGGCSKSESKEGTGESCSTPEGSKKCLTRGLELAANDAAGAVAIYLEVCDGGNGQGCTLAGHLYADGADRGDAAKSIVKDEARALELYEKACALKEPNGCFEAGNAYGIGRLNTKQDAQKSYDYLTTACENGGPVEACEFASMVKKTLDRGTPEEREALCKGGDVKACQDLGMDYRYGEHGVALDVQKALEIFGVSCDAGDGGSCAMAALIHEKGELTGEPDLAQMDKLLSRACDQDFPMACKALGRHLLNGKVLAKDANRAVPLLDKACSAPESDFEACTWLAIAYTNGDGVEADKTRAAELLDRACTGGERNACEVLGR